MQRIDLVYPIGAEPDWGHYEELRYSLRSAEKFLPQLGQVFLVGQCPDWATNVVHISHADCYDSNKDANLINKVLLACTQPDLQEHFLRLSDDQYFLKPYDPDVQAAPVASVDLAKRTFERNQYGIRQTRTLRLLQALGCTTWKFDGHHPYLYRKSEFPAAMLNVPYALDEGYCINSTYFNLVGAVPNRKPIGEVVLGVDSHKSLEELRQGAAGKWYLQNTPRALNSSFKTFLQELFPEKSRFEK